MAEKLLVLGAGPFQLPAILKGKEMGFTVVATDGNPEAVGLREADFAHAVDLRDIPGCLALARRYKVSGVVTAASETAVPAVAAVADALGLPGPGVRGAAVATNKASMRELFLKCGVPSPLVRLCDSLAQAESAAMELGFPVVVKPTDGAGSRGVNRVDTPQHVAPAFAQAMDSCREKRVLVEECMIGEEITVDGFVRDNSFIPLTLADKRSTPPPHCVDHTFLWRSLLSAEVQERAIEVVKRATEESGIENATIHAEVMITGEGPKMVEFAARGAGVKVFTDVLHWVTGVDAMAELIKMSVGQTTSLEPSCDRGAVLRFPEAPSGKVLDVAGTDEARSVAGVFDFEVWVKPGDVVRPLTSGDDRIGYFITMGASRKDAELALGQVEDALCISVAGPQTSGLPN